MEFKQLISFPQQVLPSFDDVLDAYAESQFNELLLQPESDQDIWIRSFNLFKTDIKSVRNMDPINID